MAVLPPALLELIEAFGTLPGVGPRTAERYAYFVLKGAGDSSDRLADKLKGLHGKVGYCQKTFALVSKGQTLSDLYTDPARDKQLVAVVAEPFDILALEKTGQFNGTYHVLGGLISPIDNMTPEQLHIDELLLRVKKDKVREIILATNASVEGESTALYIKQQLGKTNIKLSRLAQGLPIGVDLEYADQITLTRALQGRTTID
jgi:recombination protein RecR